MLRLRVPYAGYTPLEGEAQLVGEAGFGGEEAGSGGESRTERDYEDPLDVDAADKA
jgi:hypothetical protein